MAIEVRLEDERGIEMGRALDTSDVLGALARRDPAALSGFHLLRYVDPYGDTVFNGVQAEDLIADVAKLRESTSDADALVFLDELEELVARTREGYLLRLYGD